MVLKKLKSKVDGRAKNADPEDSDIEYNDSADISKKSDKKLSKRAVKKEKKRVAKILIDQEPKEYDPHHLYKSFKGFPRNILYRFHVRYHIDRRYLIRMRLRNQDMIDFYIFPKTGIFKFKSGAYLIDHSLSRFNNSAGCYELSYNEDFVLPIDMKYDVKELIEAISFGGISDMKAACNPQVLEQSQRSKVVQNMMSGAGLPEMLKRLLILVIAVLIVLVLYVALWMYKSGMFEQVGNII